MATDASIGKTVLVIAIAAFTYYFFWVFILPFMLINEGNVIRSLFPPLQYAFILPVGFGVIFLGGIALYTICNIYNVNKQHCNNCKVTNCNSENFENFLQNERNYEKYKKKF